MKLPEVDTLKSSFQQGLPEQKSLRTDLVAGLTFALVNIPQGMANALLAYVNPVSGLYTLMIGTPIAALVTGSVLMNVSTTGALSVATGSALLAVPSQARPQSLVVLVVLVGLMMLLAGLLRLGRALRFVSNAVMVGFTTGVAALIILGQLADFTGYTSVFNGRITSALDTLLHIGRWEPSAVAVGGLVLGIILLASRSRYASISFVVALLAGTALGAALNAAAPGSVATIPPIPDRLLAFTPPDLRYLPILLPSALGIAIIGLIQGAGVAQTFPNPDGRFGDPSRDFIGQGLANVACGVFGGIPAGGSLSGTGLVVTSGGRSRWANIFAGLWIIPAVLLLRPLFGLIPMAALSGLLIAVGILSFRPQAIRMVWDTGLPSRLAMGLTLAATLVMPLQYAVFVGVAIAIMLHVLQSSARVRLVEFKPVEGGFPLVADPPKRLESETVTILMPYGDLFFAAASNLENFLPDPGEARHAAVILSLHGHEEVGSTFIGVLQRYATTLHDRDSRLYVVGVNTRLEDQFRRTGLTQLVGPGRVIPAAQQLGVAANKALADAYAWLGKPIQYADGTPAE